VDTQFVQGRVARFYAVSVIDDAEDQPENEKHDRSGERAAAEGLLRNTTTNDSSNPEAMAMTVLMDDRFGER
jgi:hypothetical protein